MICNVYIPIIYAKTSVIDSILETLSQTVGMLQLLEFLQHSAAKSNITLGKDHPIS